MRRLLLTVLLFCALTPLYAQRYEAVKERNMWNWGYNSAGLRADSLSVSYAEVWGGLQRGAMTNHSLSDDSFTAGIKSESILHFDKISFSGALSYDYFDGRNMSGSMFITPGSWVVDIYEYTPGRKVRECYSMSGAVSYDVASEWQLGLMVDFDAVNYAKRKDLRHKNTLMDFQLSPSFRWHHQRWSLGAAYIYQKRSESLKAEEIGFTPESYRAFFDSGLFYGKEALWTSADLHLSISGMESLPIKEQLHGVSLQLGYGELLVEAEYHRLDGKTGEKGIEWHSFDADRWRARVGWQHHVLDRLHTLRLEIERELMRNNEKVLMAQTSGGVTITQEFGEVPIYYGITTELELSYDLQIGANRLSAAVAYLDLDKQSSLLYPYMREEERTRWSFDVDGVWSIGKLELIGGLNYGFGSSSHRELKVSDSDSMSSYPQRQMLYAEWYDEYMTAPILGCDLGFRVNLPKGFYIEPQAHYWHGFGLSLIPQPNRVEALLKVGCKW